MESKVVEKFLDKPYPISGLGISSSYPEPYYDYLALLHLLLIKKGMKKGFCIPVAVKYGVKICKELKLAFKKSNGTCGIVVGENNSLSKETTSEILKKGEGKWTGDIICGYDDDFIKEYFEKHCDHTLIGKLEEYPDCCVNQFVNNFWGDYESIAEVVGDRPENVDAIRERNRDSSQSEKIFERHKKILLEYADGRKKFPYAMHQACTECLSNGNNSPTGKLNSAWKKVCEEEFPELNKEILKGAKREYDDKMWWNQSYQEYMIGFAKEMKKNNY